jgi:diadenosine tetraphosphate (Ap4A) HIT family hydrolase
VTPEGRRERDREAVIVNDQPCVLCSRARSGDLIAENELAVAFPDAFPLNPGHSLVVPRRHVADLFELSIPEQQAIWNLVPVVRSAIASVHQPAGYNIGVNVGPAAGQTVAHAHVHVIPRHPGDVPDPRGGVRWVIPARAAYWNEP